MPGKNQITPERMGEIALKIVKSMAQKGPLHLGENFRREAGNRAKEISIPKEEYVQFSFQVLREVFEETFPNQE